MVVRSFLKVCWIFLAALLVFGLILGGVGYFAIRNFDPNVFRGEFEKQLSRQTGFRAELGNIKLRWQLRPQLQVDGLRLFLPQSSEVLLRSAQLLIDADLTSVLQKQFRVARVLIQSPEIFLKRDRNGAWNWKTGQTEKIPITAPASNPSQGSLVTTDEPLKEIQNVFLGNLKHLGQGWKFGVGKIFVRDATIHFTDETVSPVFVLAIAKLESEIRQSASSKAFRFTAHGEMSGSEEKNFSVDGDLDLAAQSLDLTIRYGRENVIFKGRANLGGILPHFEGTLEVRDLDMGSIIPEVYKTGEYVSGRLGVKAQFSFNGSNPDAIKRSLMGQGTLEIQNGALRNRNLVREVFSRISPVLSVTNALGGELPQEFNEMLRGADTPFQSLHVAFGAQEGIARISELRLAHPSYLLSGQGAYGILDERIDGSMKLLLARSISAYLMSKVREMEYLADRDGQVEIPFRYNGVFPNASVQPDLSYLGSRLLQNGANQLLSTGVERILGGKKAGKIARFTDAAQSQGAPSEQDQMIQQGMGMLSEILGGKKK